MNTIFTINTAAHPATEALSECAIALIPLFAVIALAFVVCLVRGFRSKKEGNRRG